MCVCVQPSWTLLPSGSWSLYDVHNDTWDGDVSPRSDPSDRLLKRHWYSPRLQWSPEVNGLMQLAPLSPMSGTSAHVISSLHPFCLVLLACWSCFDAPHAATVGTLVLISPDHPIHKPQIQIRTPASSKLFLISSFRISSVSARRKNLSFSPARRRTHFPSSRHVITNVYVNESSIIIGSRDQNFK